MLKKIEAIVKEAGAYILTQKNVKVTDKGGHANYVTNIDVEVQEFLKKKLCSLVPGSAFIGEEQKNAALTDAPSWIVDPIDGTTNFFRNWEMSTVSVAYVENKMPVFACVYQPYKDEMYTAEKGKGAFLNGNRISVSDYPLEKGLIGFGTSPYDEELAEKGMHLALEFLKNAGDLRRAGSAALDLAYIACGRQDVFFELNLKPWDIAAGALLVEEAGGKFRMPLCEKVQFEHPAAVLASNAACAEEALDLFRKYV